MKVPALTKVRRHTMQQIAIVELVTPLRRAPRPVHEELKPERVQEELRSMPDWSLLSSGTAIQSSLRFTSERAAAQYASFASATAADVGQPMRLTLIGKTLTVHLYALRRNGRAAPLDLSVIEFARQLN
jgi:pterin-4a-carbinolamine dehydratase